MKLASASERHLVLLLALLITVLVPVGLLLSPKVTWTIPLPHQVETGLPSQKMTAHVLAENEKISSLNSAPTAESRTSIADYCTIANGVVTLLVGGMLMQVAMLGRAVGTWRRIRQHAEKALLPDSILETVHAFVGGRAIPPVFISNQISVPLLSGWLRPTIILPVDSSNWSPQRLLMALCHELVHFRRGDSWLFPLTCILRIFYWWHPLVWLALARLRCERENACDDLVLNQNFRATDYADLIINTARQAHEFHWQNGALAMASSSNVGERIGAILNPGLNRRQVSRTTALTSLTFAFAIGWFLAATHVQAESQLLVSNSTITTNAPNARIQLEFKLIQIEEKTYISHQDEIDTKVANSDFSSLMNLINNLAGASVLSAPSITTQDGLKANIDIVRAVSYPTKFDKDQEGKPVSSNFKTRDTGISIEGVPILTADKQNVNLKFKCKLTSYVGWKENELGVRQPIFDTVSIQTQRLISKQGDAVWVGAPGTTRAYLADRSGDNERPSANDTAPKRILLLINAHPISTEKN